MIWEDEDEVIDDVGEEGDEPETGDDDQDARIDARIQAALTAEREKFEDEKKQFAASYGRRFDQAIRDLRNLGYQVDDQGHVLDATGNPARPVTRETSKQEKVDEEEILFDVMDDPAVATRKISRLIDRRAEEIAAQKVKELEQRVEQLQRHTAHATLSLSDPMRKASAFLDEMAPWAKDDPEFKTQFQEALKSVPAEALLDDETIDLAASVAIARTRNAYKAAGKPLPKVKPAEVPKDTTDDTAARRAAANRQALDQTRSTKGRVPVDLSDEDRDFLENGWPREWGPITAKELEALKHDNTGQEYVRRKELNEKRRNGAGAGR